MCTSNTVCKKMSFRINRSGVRGKFEISGFRTNEYIVDGQCWSDNDDKIAVPWCAEILKSH